jgi:hypothetical protein
MNESMPMLEPDRLYVIGDIHGRSDLLDRMVDEISRDLKDHPVGTALTVTLGDYVDRGFDSRGVGWIDWPATPSRPQWSIPGSNARTTAPSWMSRAIIGIAGVSLVSSVSGR